MKILILLSILMTCLPAHSLELKPHRLTPAEIEAAKKLDLAIEKITKDLELHTNQSRGYFMLSLESCKILKMEQVLPIFSTDGNLKEILELTEQGSASFVTVSEFIDYAGRIPEELRTEREIVQNTIGQKIDSGIEFMNEPWYKRILDLKNIFAAKDRKTAELMVSYYDYLSMWHGKVAFSFKQKRKTLIRLRDGEQSIVRDN